MHCSFCGNPAENLAEGPDVAICASCVPADDTCSFCRRSGTIALSRGGHRICPACVKTARQVLERAAADASASRSGS